MRSSVCFLGSDENSGNLDDGLRCVYGEDNTVAAAASPQGSLKLPALDRQDIAAERITPHLREGVGNLLLAVSREAREVLGRSLGKPTIPAHFSALPNPRTHRA
jgi:hypothetical protein